MDLTQLLGLTVPAEGDLGAGLVELGHPKWARARLRKVEFTLRGVLEIHLTYCAERAIARRQRPDREPLPELGVPQVVVHVNLAGPHLRDPVNARAWLAKTVRERFVPFLPPVPKKDPSIPPR